MIQKGNGCDYTIGCGLCVDELWGTSKEDVIAQIIAKPKNWKQDIEDDEGDLGDVLCDTYANYVDKNSERTCSSITLYEVSESTNMIPLIQTSLDEITQYSEEVQNKIKESKELEQFQKLKKKFENK